jgi:hypothetical protein
MGRTGLVHPDERDSMESHVQRQDASVPRDATADRAEHLAHIGTPNAAGLFYAACSRDYDEEICGCPVCQQAAQEGR